MRRASLTRQRLTFLGILGVVVLGFPVVGLPSGSWAGLPASYVYIFGVWAGLIGLAAWVGEGRDK